MTTVLKMGSNRAYVVPESLILEKEDTLKIIIDLLREIIAILNKDKSDKPPENWEKLLPKNIKRLKKQKKIKYRQTKLKL